MNELTDSFKLILAQTKTHFTSKRSVGAHETKDHAGMVGLAPKWARLDPKLDKSGTFSDQISVQLARAPNCTEI